MLLLHKNKYRAMHDWFGTPQGINVAAALAREVARIPVPMSGETLLQLGACGKSPWLEHLAFTRQWVVGPCIEQKQNTLVCALNSLPFDRNSVDMVVVPFAMEAYGLSGNLADEIDRVLKPSGYAIFFGVNPLSLWGASLRLGYCVFPGQAEIHPVSSLRLRHAIRHRSFFQLHFSSFHYIPPFRSKAWIDRFGFFDEMGKMLWPLPPGLYCLVVQKFKPVSPTRIPAMLSPAHGWSFASSV